MLVEHGFACPWCWEPISMLLDTSAGGDDYVEDCEVCCNPIAVRFRADDGGISDFSAERAQ